MERDRREQDGMGDPSERSCVGPMKGGGVSHKDAGPEEETRCQVAVDILISDQGDGAQVPAALLMITAHPREGQRSDGVSWLSIQGYPHHAE